MTNNDTARQLHVEKINEVKELLKECKPNTPHYRDLKKYYQKLRKELYVYDMYMICI